MKAAFVSAAALAVFTLLGLGFIRSAAPTYDEAIHLASGYASLLASGPNLTGRDNPPFAEMWEALPLAALRPRAFFSSLQWQMREVYRYADLFLYHNRVSAARLLNSARLWSLLSLGAIFAFVIAEWSLRLGGLPAAVFSAALFAFCPALISNASLAATDAPAAALYFLSFWMLSFRPRRKRHWLAFGVFAGLAAASKFSMIFLPAAAAAACGAELWAEGWRRPPLLGPVIAASGGFFALWAVYRFGPLDWFWSGAARVFSEVKDGRSAFFFGLHSSRGWLLYFPAALAVKTPIPALLLSGAGLFFWLKPDGSEDRPLRSAKSSPDISRRIFASGLWLVLPPAAFLAAACLSRMDIGYRHVLCVYPFMAVLGGLGAAGLWKKKKVWRPAVLGLLAWLAAGVVHAYPYYLEYFNVAVGGPARGYRLLVDSNLDWGQDLKPLAAYLKRRGDPPIIFSYFGTADPAYYGVRYIPLGFVDNLGRSGDGARLRDFGPLLLAISVTNLQGDYYRDKKVWSWLELRQPVFRAGHSIFVYDLTADPAGVLRLAAIFAGNGGLGLARRLLLHYGHGRPSAAKG